MEPSPIEAPIVAVTVFPDRARVTRRGNATLPAGEHRLRIAPLPLGLRRDSLRVGGRGPATVLGVDTSTRREPRSTNDQVVELTRRRQELAAEQATLTDADEVEQRRDAFLATLTERAAGTYARALAAGDVAPADLATFADAVAGQTAESRDRRRRSSLRRVEVGEEIAAIDRQLQAVRGKRRPDQLAADVTVSVDEPGGEVELELTYLVDGAGWQPSYDVRLADDTVTVTWFGVVSQQTGEDWPECDLRLSTARPAAATAVPDLKPWYLDRERPMPAFPAAASAGLPPAPGGPPPARARAVHADADVADAAPVRQSVATVEQGVAAATYRPARAVAVPADGSSHRATVAVFDLPAQLDYVTAPVRAPEAYLRATVRNTSPHTLLPGVAAVFHGPDFVGSTPLRAWAPGEETELAIGLDDRIRVQRVLARRGDSKATLGSTRRREVEYRITVANHTPRPANVAVLDQLPVSRDEGIVVRELRLEPAPAERSDLGELTWRFRLAPGQSTDITLALRVDVAKSVEMVGWRE